MCRTILGALLGALLLLATPVAAREKPLLSPGEHLPLLVEDPLAGVEGTSPGIFYYQQSVGLVLGTAFAAADQARANDAAEIIAPLFDDLNLADELIAELERSLDRNVFGRELVIERHPETVPDLGDLEIDHQVIFTRITLEARDFARLFITLRMRHFDRETYSMWRAPRQHAVTYEVRFPELVPTAKRLENARRLAALGPERVLAGVRAAIPELVAMMNYEVQRAGRKEKKLGTKRIHVPFGGRQAMKIVQRRDERLWARWKSIGLYSVPSAPEPALEQGRQVGSRGRAMPARKDGTR